MSREEHERLLSDVDGYRPKVCNACNSSNLHAHDFRVRKSRNDEEAAVYVFRRYKCMGCLAIWQVLAAFMARHLHRPWKVIQSVLVETGDLSATGTERRCDVPQRTVLRWRARLVASAAALVQALAEAGTLARSVLGARRRLELVEAVAGALLVEPGRKLGALAGWIHRIVPGLRLV
ncbi:MAG: hypothetical protein JRH20_29510 [Deltaproteobacteria bacterium]|nr:hypothetical protein [Deltaproteobacteria bacterium]